MGLTLGRCDRGTSGTTSRLAHAAVAVAGRSRHWRARLAGSWQSAGGCRSRPSPEGRAESLEPSTGGVRIADLLHEHVALARLEAAKVLHRRRRRLTPVGCVLFFKLPAKMTWHSCGVRPSLQQLMNAATRRIALPGRWLGPDESA
jgi:hypothetical protein